MSSQLSTRQPASNEAESLWNSHRVPLQQITGSATRTGRGGRERLYIFGWAVCKLFDLMPSLLPSLNLPGLVSSFVCTSFFLSVFVAVLPPGSVGKHGALDGLLRRLLRHLAHHPHRPRHAGPGKSHTCVAYFSNREWGSRRGEGRDKITLPTSAP